MGWKKEKKIQKKIRAEKSATTAEGLLSAEPKPEFDQKILNIRRVTRVVAGGRRFSFSVALVAGDKKGVRWFGSGKSRRYGSRNQQSST